MKKVATLSFQHAYNYGAVFQVEALQNIITKLGADCDIIDYRCPAIDKQYDFRPIKISKNILSAIRANLVLAPFIRKKKKNFFKWMNSYKKTRTISTKKNLIALNKQYDKFIVGSDQVWNLHCHGYDEAFFLDFVTDNSKKIAYAASFGTYDIRQEDLSFYKKYIASFEHISVRENRGVELVKEIAGKESIACMDPVLLAGRDFWLSKTDSKIVPEKKYIFVYQLGHGKEIPQFVKQLKKESGLPVYFTTGHIGNMIHYAVSDHNMSSTSPEQFLALLSNAEFIVTNSFHATVLSIIFQRQFYVISRGGEKSSYNTRIHNLLSVYDLKNRIQSKYIPMEDISKEKFEEVEHKRKILCEESLRFLQTSIGLE